ncbi:hypothetical protein ACVWXP_003751 [Bradyrhizobium sp. USDA 4463]
MTKTIGREVDEGAAQPNLQGSSIQAKPAMPFVA